MKNPYCEMTGERPWKFVARDERHLSAALAIEVIRHNLDRLVANMTVVRDEADRGDPIRADFRAACKHLETAIDHMDRAIERFK